jgi:hypothetical protein
MKEALSVGLKGEQAWMMRTYLVMPMLSPKIAVKFGDI